MLSSSISPMRMSGRLVAGTHRLVLLASYFHRNEVRTSSAGNFHEKLLIGSDANFQPRTRPARRQTMKAIDALDSRDPARAALLLLLSETSTDFFSPRLLLELTLISPLQIAPRSESGKHGSGQEQNPLRR